MADPRGRPASAAAAPAAAAPAVALALALAACWTSSLPAVQPAAPGPAEGSDLGLLLAPRDGADDAQALLDARAVPMWRTTALLESLDPEALTGDDDADGDGDPTNDRQPAAYDLDGDGLVDLVAIPRLMYGPSEGWSVYLARSGGLELAFSVSGDWADARYVGGMIALRFQANVLAPGEARFSLLLRFANAGWAPLVKAYAASQTEIPAASPPFERFEIAGKAALRARPALDDRPRDGGDDGDDGDDDAHESFESTATLRGNALAVYATGAGGLVLARQGAWRYVAFEPAARPLETSLAHGMDFDEDVGGVRAWRCGWIRAADAR